MNKTTETKTTAETVALIAKGALLERALVRSDKRIHAGVVVPLTYSGIY